MTGASFGNPLFAHDQTPIIKNYLDDPFLSLATVLRQQAEQQFAEANGAGALALVA